MGTEVTGVVASAIDEGGFSAAQELTADEVHARRTNDPSVMPDHAFAVENGDFEPRIVRPVAGSPDDRLDLARGKIEAERRRFLNARGPEAVWRLSQVVKAVLPRPAVDQVQQPAHLEIGKRAHVAQ